MQLCCSPRRLQLFSVFLAVVAIITVLIILFLYNYPTFARRRVVESVVFRNGTMELDRFESTVDLVNLRVSFNIYNVTNPDEVTKGLAPVKLQEIGPFVYHEFKSKEFIDNNQTSGLITFKLKKRYNFQPLLSIGDPSKINIIWPNVPLIAAGTVLDNLNFVEKAGAYALINKFIAGLSEPAFITDTVENLIFDGSKRLLFEQIQQSWFGSLIKPWPLKDNKFGIFYDKNDTWHSDRDHVFTVSAGLGNQPVSSLNQYLYMNYSSNLPYWHNDNSSDVKKTSCNRLEGTDGQFFAPFVNSSNSLTAYAIDICRKLELKYRETVPIKGITTYRYSLAENSMQSGLKNPENDCYCIDRSSDGTPSDMCKIDGLIDLSSCVAPNIYASGAHFLYGDKNLSARVLGVKQANVSSDEPVVYIEPNTGATIQSRVPLQLNVKMQKNGFNIFSFFQDDKPLIIPLLTLVEAAEPTDEQASMLRSKLLLLDLWLVTVVLGGAIVFILAIIATIAVLCIRNSRRNAGPSETDPLIATSEEDGPQEDGSSNSQRPSNYQAV